MTGPFKGWRHQEQLAGLLRQVFSGAKAGLVIVLASIAPCHAAEGENAAGTQAEPADEIIVRGKRLAALRDEFHRAQEHFFSVFNSLNSDDEYDIHCQYRFTITRFKERVCEANFVGKLGSMHAAAGMTGAHAVAPAFIGMMHRKDRLLFEEMQRLVRAHPDLREAFVDLVDASQGLKGLDTRVAQRPR